MQSDKLYVGEFEIVGSGVAIGNKGDTTFLHAPILSPNPIPITIDLGNYEVAETEYEDRNKNKLYFNIRHPVEAAPMGMLGSGSANEITMSIATDFHYYFSYALHFVGQVNDYCYILTYNITRKPK